MSYILQLTNDKVTSVFSASWTTRKYSGTMRLTGTTHNLLPILINAQPSHYK
ncbi:hypothetical protein DSUL_10003 [Desulfovibrionales bacterium]